LAVLAQIETRNAEVVPGERSEWCAGRTGLIRRRCLGVPGITRGISVLLCSAQGENPSGLRWLHYLPSLGKGVRKACDGEEPRGVSKRVTQRAVGTKRAGRRIPVRGRRWRKRREEEKEREEGNCH